MREDNLYLQQKKSAPAMKFLFFKINPNRNKFLHAVKRCSWPKASMQTAGASALTEHTVASTKSQCGKNIGTAVTAAKEQLATEQVTKASATTLDATREVKTLDAVKIVAAYPTVLFVHKPSGMCTHPYRTERAKAPAGNANCPVCNRAFVSKKHVKGWLSMKAHLENTPDKMHQTWRINNPDGLCKVSFLVHREARKLKFAPSAGCTCSFLATLQLTHT